MMNSRVCSIAAMLAVSSCVLAAGSTIAYAAEGGSVTGTVVSATTGKPLAGICVNVVEAKENQTVGTSEPTSKTGVWTLSNIAPSTTYTAIAAHCAGAGDYVAQWYDQQEFQSNATDFGVSSGLATSNINFSLSAGGEVTGKVTNATTKKSVAGILVVGLYTTAFQTATNGYCTTSNGKYKLTGAPTSGLYVEFLPNDCGVTSNYSTIWYLNSPSYGSATFVPITADKTTKDINQAVSEG